MLQELENVVKLNILVIKKHLLLQLLHGRVHKSVSSTSRDVGNAEKEPGSVQGAVERVSTVEMLAALIFLEI